MIMTETAEWDLAMHIAEDIGLGKSQIAMTFGDCSTCYLFVVGTHCIDIFWVQTGVSIVFITWIVGWWGGGGVSAL